MVGPDGKCIPSAGDAVIHDRWVCVVTIHIRSILVPAALEPPVLVPAVLAP